MDAAPCCFIQDCPYLRDLDGLGDLLFRLHLRHGDGQDAVLYLGRNLIFHDIIRQRVANKGLTEYHHYVIAQMQKIG